MSNKMYIIDGNSLLFRAYYATAYGSNPTIMRTKDGTPTNAVFAFANMINKIISSFKGDESIIVGFDTGQKTFRHEENKDYKANRKPCPPDLKTQMPIARNLLKSLGIFTYEKDGVEGDDICGTIAKLAEKNGIEVEIFTSDRDFLQLISKYTTVNILVKGMKDIREMNEGKMQEEYGITPLQIIDYKGLRGDASDNIPGIPGIGEKTAIKLIQEFGSFDNIIAASAVQQGKIWENIREFRTQGEESRHLAIIKCDVELPFGIEDLKYRGFEFDVINSFCQKYELKQLLNRLPSRFKQIEKIQDFIITERASLDDVEFSDELSIAIDMENINYNDAEIYGLAVFSNGNTYYIDIEHLQSDIKFISLLENPNIRKYAFDYKAIKVALNRFGIDLKGLYFDILLASYILDSSLNNDADLVMNYFGKDISTKSSDEMSLFSQKNIEKTGKIACYTRQMHNEVRTSLEKVGALKLFDDVEIPLAEVLAKMEVEGFPLNVKKLEEIGSSFRIKLDQSAKEIYEQAGEEFNISSPKQVAKILFEKLKLAKSKNESTSVDVLSSLINEHPIIEKILDYRKYSKLIGTYIDGLKVHVRKDGKIHAIFNQSLTSTGRLSSSEPNLQNISVRDEEGKLIRKAFYYPNNEFSILSLDYSQIELRILASLSKCNPLIEVFNNDLDIHAATAKKVFKLNREPTDQERRRAKAVNFGIVYGISDWGLAEQIGVSLNEAKGIISSFFEAYPEVGTFLNNVVANATNNGYVTTMFNRRRYLRDIHDSNYQVREFSKRAAMNAPIQGTAADLIKIAMVKVDKILREQSLQTKLVLQIHDELLFKVPNQEKSIIFDLIKQIMENAFKLDVKLSVDGGFGLTWYDAK